MKFEVLKWLVSNGTFILKDTPLILSMFMTVSLTNKCTSCFYVFYSFFKFDRSWFLTGFFFPLLQLPYSYGAATRYKSNEDYVYVRGRGRGKYICEECGIRCKKPSMLKKHIRTHTDVRPYHCNYCNFSFKTKGRGTSPRTFFPSFPSVLKHSSQIWLPYAKEVTLLQSLTV